MCTSCELMYYVLDAAGRCETCDPEVFARARGWKERAIRDFLDLQGVKYETHDRRLPDGCGLERPDFLIDNGHSFLVLEIDEDQHEGYACVCEQTRMVNISQALGMRTVFIRYNPDRFTVDGQTRKVSDTRRQEELLRVLARYRYQPPGHFCSAVYMFYNGSVLTDEIGITV